MTPRRVLIVSGTVVAVFAVLVALILRPAERANRFLSQLQAALRSHSPQQAVPLILSYGGRADRIDQDDSLVQVDFNNRILRQLRLAPNTNLSAAAYVHGGTVQYVAVSYTVGGQPFRVDLVVLDFLGAKNELPVRFEDAPIVGATAARARIKFTYDAPQEFRHQALSLRTACLYKLSGCRKLDELLPDIERLREHRPD